MQVLIWAIRLFVVLVLVWFAVKNAQPVTLYGMLDYHWQAPLVLILLLFFTGGVMFGLLAAFGTVFKLKRQVSALKKQLKQAQTPPAAEAANVPVQPLPPPHGD
jgi:lipopolysaccharide assembly protein A